MSRKRYERHKLAEERWPLLCNLLARYFNQNFELLYGSLAGAFEAASGDGTLEHRRSVISEWKDWNVAEGTASDVRPFLQDGFGIDISFKEPIDGRHFMNRLHDELATRVRAEAAL